MKKTLKAMVLLVSSLILFTACGKSQTTNHKLESTNLVHNGSFEQGPDGWHTKNQFLNDVTGWVTEEHHSGKHSLKIENIGGTNAYWQGEPIVFKEPANAFETSIWTKTKNIKENKGKFEIVLDVWTNNNNEEKHYRKVINILDIGHRWIQTKGKAVFAGNIVKIVPSVYFSGNIGTVYLDDFSIVPTNIAFVGKVLFDSNSNALVSDSGNIEPVSNKNGKKIFEVKGKQPVFSKDLIEIDSNKTYLLSGMFKSKSSENSKLFFGYIPLTKDKKFIPRQSVQYVTNSETELIRACTNGDSILYIKNGTEWYSDPGCFIGFDVDNSGKYADLPNFNLSPSISKAIQKGSFWKIELSAPCTKNYPRGTKVREHVDNGMGIYDFNAGRNVDIPDTWTKCKGIKSDYIKFYPGTKYVQIILINYKPSGVLDYDFKNIKMMEINL